MEAKYRVPTFKQFKDNYIMEAKILNLTKEEYNIHTSRENIEDAYNTTIVRNQYVLDEIKKYRDNPDDAFITVLLELWKAQLDISYYRTKLDE